MLGVRGSHHCAGPCPPTEAGQHGPGGVRLHEAPVLGLVDSGQDGLHPDLHAGEILVPALQGAVGHQHLAQKLGRSPAGMGVQGVMGQCKGARCQLGQDPGPGAGTQPVKGAVGLAGGGDRLVDRDQRRGDYPRDVRQQLPGSGGQGTACAAPTILQDANQWSDNRGLPKFSGSQFQQVVAPGTFHHPESGGKNKQDPQGWYGEETLDVESVHGMAPAANVVYVGAPNNFQDLDAALNHVVDRHLAQIVTNSYGFPTEFLPFGFIKPYEDTILQGAVEGIGIYFSSGDNNDESLVVGYKTADWPASSPFVTAVGGTSLAVGAGNSYLFETGWGSRSSNWTGTTWKPTPPGTWLYGSGGGVSRLFAEPSYQVGVVQSAVFAAQGRTGRAVPDIAALGDPNTGYIVGETQTFPDGSIRYSEYRLGGTSLSSPIMAGIMALADQKAGRVHGFANPFFYSKAGSTAFKDIVNPSGTVAVVRTNFVNGVDSSDGLVYRLRTMNQTLSLQTTPGYDDVTGLGTPTADFLAIIGT